jgi:arylsulfatase A-like enzyme
MAPALFCLLQLKSSNLKSKSFIMQGAFKNSCIVLVSAGIIYGCFVFAVKKPVLAAPRPNIIFIMADDMGFSDIGSYGGEVATPHLDNMAAAGIKLRSFYNNARCCPTRASLLTGQYPHTVGMGKMVTMPDATYEPGSYQGFLDPAYPTIAEALRQAGYKTYMSGKWHVGERPEHWPLKRGFDRYFGLISGASSFYEITPQEKAKRRFLLDDKDYSIPKEGFYATDAFTDHAIGYLNEHSKNNTGDPFFLYLAYTAPHFPLHALEEDIKKYETAYLKGWDVLRNERFERMKTLGYVDARYQLSPKTKGVAAWDDAKEKQVWARKMAVYAAMIDRMDQNIGRMMETLKRNGQFENTLVVFLSDNGACAEEVRTSVLHDPAKKIGEKGSYTIYGEAWANASNTPFKEYKHYMHEGGIATPCIVQWPAGIRPQQGFVEGVGHVMDLMPTALELAGVRGNSVQGKSLTYLWNGKKHPERTYCWEHEGNKAIRKGKWKLVKEHKDQSWELYDMQADPVEMDDLAATYPARVQSLLREYVMWEKQVGVRAQVSK